MTNSYRVVTLIGYLWAIYIAPGAHYEPRHTRTSQSHVPSVMPPGNKYCRFNILFCLYWNSYKCFTLLFSDFFAYAKHCAFISIYLFSSILVPLTYHVSIHVITYTWHPHITWLFSSDTYSSCDELLVVSYYSNYFKLLINAIQNPNSGFICPQRQRQKVGPTGPADLGHFWFQLNRTGSEGPASQTVHCLVGYIICAIFVHYTV
jgi:hypothetical protein